MATSDVDPKCLPYDVRKDNYDDFIKKIRVELTQTYCNGISVLAPERHSGMSEDKDWLDIKLIAGGSNITLRLQKNNLNVRGYRRGADKLFWEFTDTHLIDGSRDLLLSGSYFTANGIVKTGGVSREELPLGAQQFEEAIRDLAGMESPLGPNAKDAARNLLVIIQTVVEAARYQTISKYISANYNTGAVINGEMVAMENCWGRLSSALLEMDLNPTPTTPLPNIEAENPSHVYIFSKALDASGILVDSRQRGGAMMNGNHGRSLMNLEYVRVNNINNQNPGKLFGKVTVYDGWYAYTFYNRGSTDPESVGPSELATLTDSSQPYAVSGADAFTVSIDLSNLGSSSHEDKIAQGEIVWDTVIESVTFEDYDKHLQRDVTGKSGNVTVGYSVLSNALGVTIQVVLVNADGKTEAGVYGTLKASQVLGGSAGQIPITLLDKSSKEPAPVEIGKPIPLTRKIIAASMSTNLTIAVDLKASPDGHEIAGGNAIFTVQGGEQTQNIKGQYGEVQVIINCE